MDLYIKKRDEFVLHFAFSLIYFYSTHLITSAVGFLGAGFGMFLA